MKRVAFQFGEGSLSPATSDLLGEGELVHVVPCTASRKLGRDTISRRWVVDEMTPPALDPMSVTLRALVEAGTTATNS